MNPYAIIGDTIAGIDSDEALRFLIDRKGSDATIQAIIEATSLGMAIERLERSMLPGCYVALTGGPGIAPYPNSGWTFFDTAWVQSWVNFGWNVARIVRNFGPAR